jgi:hypothetical protein
MKSIEAGSQFFVLFPEMYKATGGIFGRHSYTTSTLTHSDQNTPSLTLPQITHADVATFADTELTNTEKILIYLHERAHILTDQLKDMKADDPMRRHTIGEKEQEIENLLECLSQGFEELHVDRAKLINQRRLSDDISSPSRALSEARSPRLEAIADSPEVRKLREREGVMSRIMAAAKVDIDALTTWKRLHDEALKEAGLEQKESAEPPVSVLSPRSSKPDHTLFASQAGSHGSVLGHTHAHNNMLHTHSHIIHNQAVETANTEEQRKAQRDKVLMALIAQEIHSPKP